MTQDSVISEGVMATPRSGGGNFGMRGHDVGHYPFLFEDEGVFV